MRIGRYDDDIGERITGGDNLLQFTNTLPPVNLLLVYTINIKI